MLKLYKPSLNELSFRQELLSDEATMAYNHAYGGCIDFPKEKWESWKNKWLESNNGKYFYRYLYDTEQKNSWESLPITMMRRWNAFCAM